MRRTLGQSVLAAAAFPTLEEGDHSEKHQLAWRVAGIFAIIATCLSLYQIRLHIKWNQNNNLRKYTLRILMMVPIYAIESWLGLRFKTTAVYFEAARECYESLVIYSFLNFLVEYVGGERHIIRVLRAKAPHQHLFPFCCLEQWQMGPDFYFKTKTGVLQFVVLKPLMALLSWAFDTLGMYWSEEFSLATAYPYIMLIDNISQTVAIYCLCLFYIALKDELMPANPVPKFLVVKAVVFFTFWQSVGLSILVKIGVLRRTGNYSADDIVTSLQDFLVCVEMFVASISHHYAFSYKEFYNPVLAPAPAGKLGRRMIRSLIQAVDVSDVFVDDVDTALNPHHPLRYLDISNENSPLLAPADSAVPTLGPGPRPDSAGPALDGVGHGVLLPLAPPGSGAANSTGPSADSPNSVELSSLPTHTATRDHYGYHFQSAQRELSAAFASTVDGAAAPPPGIDASVQSTVLPLKPVVRHFAVSSLSSALSPSSSTASLSSSASSTLTAPAHPSHPSAVLVTRARVALRGRSANAFAVGPLPLSDPSDQSAPWLSVPSAVPPDGSPASLPSPALTSSPLEHTPRGSSAPNSNPTSPTAQPTADYSAVDIDETDEALAALAGAEPVRSLTLRRNPSLQYALPPHMGAAPAPAPSGHSPPQSHPSASGLPGLLSSVLRATGLVNKPKTERRRAGAGTKAKVGSRHRKPTDAAVPPQQ